MEDSNRAPAEESTPQQDLASIYDQSFPSFTPGEIVKGRIVKRIGNSVLVDLGLKSEGVLSIDEFRRAEDAEEGKEIFVFLEALEGREGMPAISKRKADFQLAWETIKQKAESGEGVPAEVRKKVKGGLSVEVFGLDAFLPASQVDIRPVPNLDEMIGRKFDVEIVKVNWSKKNIVVSRRMLLEKKQEELRRQILAQLKPGDLIDGTVKNLTDFGAFVDIGGVDALLHITDISWNKIVHPSEIIQVGQQLKLKVLTLDPETGRITVGLKQLLPHPWEGVEDKYPIGSRVKGRVTSLADYGAFVELEKGVEGLIHVSEMSWTKTIRHPAQILKVGDQIDTVVLNIDKENRRISLGLKQTMPDPWSIIEDKYVVGQKVVGRVKSLKEFGAFVEIEEGIEGLVHNSDLSWTKKVKHPREVLKKSQRVETIVLSIDKENRRISLGLKQTKEDPFYRLSKERKENDVVTGKVIDLPAGGIVVEIDYGIEAYIPLHQLARKGLKKSKDKYGLGEDVQLAIRRIDLGARKVILSERALGSDGEREAEPAADADYDAGKERFTIEEHLQGDREGGGEPPESDTGAERESETG